MASVYEAYRRFQDELERGRAEVAPREVLDMLELALNCAELVGRGQVALERLEFPAPKEAEVIKMVQRRIAGEPLGQILGYAWFYGRKFKVTPDVLIPRPDTEVLVVEVLKRLQDGARIVDVGVGSGCVMGTLLAERVDVEAIGIEISPAAALVAEQNLRDLGVGERGKIVVRDGLEGTKEPRNQGTEDGVWYRFNLLVSNPPYVTDVEWENLESEVRDYEPRLALTGGVPNADGLVFYRRLAEWGRTRLVQGGWLCVETGWQQAQAVRDLLQEQNNDGAVWQDITITKDLGGRERVVCARKR